MSNLDKQAGPKSVLFIGPFYGGSHKIFADNVASMSAHHIRLMTLPASFWKWRMRGAHLTLMDKIKRLIGKVDCLLTSDMLSLGELSGVVPELAGLPGIVYFHENQLSYPVPKGESPDAHFGFTNISTAVAADKLLFNSRFHMEEFIGGIESFLRAMPDHRPKKIEEILRKKSTVVYPGIDCDLLDSHQSRRTANKPLTVIWNHRWEFDKRPEVFFSVLRDLADEGPDFRVNVLGENFQAVPTVFNEAREYLGDRIVHFGYLPGRADYIRALWEADIAVSTSIQEFFGISMMEAAYCGCFPLVPDRLVYPELYPEEYLYRDDDELYERLRKFLREGLPAGPWRDSLRAGIRKRYDVKQSVTILDNEIKKMGSGSCW